MNRNVGLRRNSRNLFLFGMIAMGSCLSGPVWSEGLESPRWLGLEGAVNARDAGGYETWNGSQVRWGLLYRSNQLTYLSQPDQDRFRALRIKTIIDFRTDLQVLAYPNVESVTERASYRHLPIDITGETYEEIYKNMVTRYASSLAQAMLILADPNNLPCLCHCLAGKDRTGVFIALVHRLVGVSPDDCMVDYLKSLEIGYGVDPNWLDAVFQIVEEEGGIELFWVNRGVSRAIQQKVRDNLLEPVSEVRNWEWFDSSREGSYETNSR